MFDNKTLKILKIYNFTLKKLILLKIFMGLSYEKYLLLLKIKQEQYPVTWNPGAVKMMHYLRNNKDFETRKYFIQTTK